MASRQMRALVGFVLALAPAACGGLTVGVAGSASDAAADASLDARRDAGPDSPRNGDGAMGDGSSKMPCRGSTACNAGGWCASDPTPTGSPLAAVWMDGTDDVWVAGGPAVLHWDGTSWSNIDTGTAGIGALWGTSPSDMWAMPPGEAIISHWDGKAWSAFSSLPDRVTVAAIWGSGPNDVWAVGANNPDPEPGCPGGSSCSFGSIQHFDGSSWSSTTSIGGSTFGALTAVWGSGTDDVWAVGDTGDVFQRSLTLHWDGTQWTNVTLNGAKVFLEAVWGSGASDVWAIGGATPSTGAGSMVSGAALHWDGSQWLPVGGLADLENPAGLWGSSSDDVWAVGASGMAAHWNGMAWSVMPTGTSSALRAVTGSAANDVWAVGDYGALQHWNGAAWSSPGQGGFRGGLSIWGASSTDVWVGRDGELEHWNGASWATSSFPGAGTIVPIWGIDTRDVWAVGSGDGPTPEASMLHWDGSSWSNVTTPPNNHPEGLWGSGTNDIWAVDTHQPVLHWNGASWAPSVSKTMTFGTAVWGSASDDVWIVGGGSTGTSFVHWDGKDWSITTTGSDPLLAVWGSASNDVWAVGSVVMHHWNGASWRDYPLPPRMDYLDLGITQIWGRNSNDVWVAGHANYGQTLLHWDGSSWSLVPSGAGYFLAGIWGTSDGLLAVGSSQGSPQGAGILCHP